MSVVPLFREVYGFQTDPPVADMPNGYMRRLINFLPTPGIAPLRRRGGIANAATLGVTNSAVKRLCWAPWSGVPMQGIAVLANLVTHRFEDPNGGTSSTAGTFTALPGWPVFHRLAGKTNGGLVIFPAGVGQVAQKLSASGNIANLGGTPPTGGRGASWGDYFILARDVTSTDKESRMWFSAVGDPEIWNTTTGYIDFPEKIEAVVPLGKVIFVLGPTGVHILRGDTPPPGSNFTLDKFVFKQGLSDERGVAVYKDSVIWANRSGVWKTDGGNLVDLTRQGGISTFWPIFYGQSSSDTIQVAVFRNYLFICSKATGLTDPVTLIYDLEKNSWWEWNNLDANVGGLVNMPGLFGTYDEDLLFGGSGNVIRKISTAFDWSSNASDANGQNYSAILYTPSYRFGIDSYKRIKKTWVTLQSSGSAAGTIAHSLSGEPDVATAPSDLTTYDTLSVGAQTSKR